MAASRALTLALVITLAGAHIASHDNILRIQLWDAEGLSKEPLATEAATHSVQHSRVNLESLYSAMLEESDGDVGRFTRHKVRHKRRRPRSAGELPWRFHRGESVNVAAFDADVPWTDIEHSAVSDSETREVAAMMTLQQDPDYEEEEIKQPIVRKCCPIGQNLTTDETGKRICTPSVLTFQPLFYKANETHIWSFESNVFETIVGNPCKHDRYLMDPKKDSADEFKLIVNGSLFVPFQRPYLLSTNDFCMETFWNESEPAGVTLPVVCFQGEEIEEANSSTLIAYAVGLLISVPFLLATAAVYIFIRELRDTHGKALACHTVCLAMAFSCLAATQLAGHAFPKTACSIMAHLIQFSFLSCFFWLNVMCYDTLLNVRSYIGVMQTRRAMRRRFAFYCAYAVTLPLILLIVTMVMELSPAIPNTYLKPNFGVKGCWFENKNAAWPYFYYPVAALLLSNTVMFFLTSRAFATHYDKLKDVTTLELTTSEYSTAADDWARLGAVIGEPLHIAERSPRPVNLSQRLKKYRKVFRTCCLLSFIMGLTWVMEVVSWAAGAGDSIVSVWSIFDVINALQGVVIFAIYVLQQPIRSKVKLSRLCSPCRARSSGSDIAVVSERTSIDCGTGRRDYV